MPLIHLTSFIAAPIQRVFDLSRSVDLHRASMKSYGEQCIAGCMSGLMTQGAEVTWQARHLYRLRQLKMKLTQMDAPHFFADEMIAGDFRSMKHEHYFRQAENGTIMIDQLSFETPYGILGKLLNTLVLENYMKRLLTEKNAVLKRAAEGQLWKQYLTT